MVPQYRIFTLTSTIVSNQLFSAKDSSFLYLNIVYLVVTLNSVKEGVPLHIKL
jgi:hypothetical protein